MNNTEEIKCNWNINKAERPNIINRLIRKFKIENPDDCEGDIYYVGLECRASGGYYCRKHGMLYKQALEEKTNYLVEVFKLG